MHHYENQLNETQETSPRKGVEVGRTDHSQTYTLADLKDRNGTLYQDNIRTGSKAHAIDDSELQLLNINNQNMMFRSLGMRNT